MTTLRIWKKAESMGLNNSFTEVKIGTGDKFMQSDWVGKTAIMADLHHIIIRMYYCNLKARETRASFHVAEHSFGKAISGYLMKRNISRRKRAKFDIL